MWEAELKEKEAWLQTKEHTVSRLNNTLPEKVVATGESTVKNEAGGFQRASPRDKQTNLPLQATYQNGFCLSTPGPNGFSLCLGGLLQTDYRYFHYEGEDPNKNKFDLRRVRLQIKGQVTRRFDYKFEYEFEGAGSRRLLDAYADAHLFPFVSFRIGQFKEPFGLEHLTLDKDGFFVERSMGFYLTPGRDVGVMAYASLWNDRINYGLGVFNGDGLDDATHGDSDDPEWTGRLVCAPFKNRGIVLADNLQVGGSFGYARIDPTNVEIHVKTTGFTPFFDVASRAKFNIIREVDHRARYGAEFAWTYGPFAVTGEYFQLRFQDITTSAEQFNTDLADYYVVLLWMVTGEKPVLKKGVFQSIKPRKSIRQGGWGGLGLAFRYDHFSANRSVYEDLIYAGNSVRVAKAYSIALKWYLDSFALVTFDATRTTFDRSLLIGRDPLQGIALYSDREDVFSGRFQLEF